MKLSLPIRAIIVTISVLLIVSFYESKRVEMYAVQIENDTLRSCILAYTEKVKSIKSLSGLKIFFAWDENFWKHLKNGPDISVASPNVNPEPTVHPEPLPFSTISSPFTALIVGDSFIAESFGPALEKELLSFQNITVFRKGKYSTGLSRPDYFNWEKEIQRLITENRPNIAFVMFGANDGQSQTGFDIKTIRYGTNGWDEEYEIRITRFLKILEDNNIFVFWIGNSIAKEKYYADEMAHLNSLYMTICKNFPNCLYLDTWNALATSQGEYSAYLPDENGNKRLARASDGIHTSAFGSQLMLKQIMAKVMEKIKLQKIE